MPPFPESPRCLRPFQGNLFSLHRLTFQDEDRLTPRWLVGQPCRKASWESLVGKPRGKATDPLIHANGSSTLQLQLGRKAHVHAPTRNEDRLTRWWHVGQPCGKASWESHVGKPRGKTRNPLINPTGKLTLLLMLGRKAHAHAPIGDEDDSPVETPVVPQDPFQHWRGNLRFGHRFQKRS